MLCSNGHNSNHGYGLLTQPVGKVICQANKTEKTGAVLVQVLLYFALWGLVYGLNDCYNGGSSGL